MQKWATAYSISAPKMKLKQMPRYTSMALMKQLALGRDVLAPIISVVIVRTVVTPVPITHTESAETLVCPVLNRAETISRHYRQ